MKIVIVNASAAKGGGAETIIRTFVDTIKENDGNTYIVISPLRFANLPLNVRPIHVKTSGIGSILFSTIGVFYYIIKYNATKIISFNNINCIFFADRGITYFHQLKALENYKELKIRIYHFIIRNFLKKNYFIVQTDAVRDLFLGTYPMIKPNRVLACWPGFVVPPVNHDMLELTIGKDFKYLGLLPISYDSDHKNIVFLLKLEDYFQRAGIHIVSLLSPETSPLRNSKVFSNIGEISRPDLFKLYSACDFMIFTSKSETVGLPIFEFLQMGRPAFVLDLPYSRALYKQFNFPENFCLFDSEDDFISKFDKGVTMFDNSRDYSKGEWSKVYQLL